MNTPPASFANCVVSSNSFSQQPCQPEKRSYWWRFGQKARLLSFTDFFITTDLTGQWRHHLVRYYSHKPLQEIVMGRYGPTMLVLSLLLGSEINVFFSPSDIATGVRHAMASASSSSDDDDFLQLVTGFVMIASIVVTFSALLANYTAMGVFATVHPANAAIIYRSDVGLYAAQLPARMTVLSFYLFVTWMLLMFCINLGSSSPTLAAFVALCSVLVIAHVVLLSSAAARLILATRAMGPTPICDDTAFLTPSELTTVLLKRADAKLAKSSFVRTTTTTTTTTPLASIPESCCYCKRTFVNKSEATSDDDSFRDDKDLEIGVAEKEIV